MLNSPRSIELLAPARNAEAGITAVNYGADAVYMGAPKFSARADAGNPVAGFEKLVRYAHRFHARVYAALNTILFDGELEEARQMILDLAGTGIDALIIQDMGILQMDLPPVELHASTQTNNFEPERIRFLEKAGFSRVILARELSLDQIRKIREQTSLELECFVHGALCVSMSGQCYMSLASGERSGNRGVCAQPCRKLYDLEDAGQQTIIRQKHLLSLKDLDLSDHLAELAFAGISGFKIEGRLKDINYVKNITAWYRKKIDAFLEGNVNFRKSSSGKIIFDFEPDPAKTFSRGTGNYFLHGRHSGITSFDTPKSAGEWVGNVISSSGKSVILNPVQKISNNDGITWFSPDGVLQGAKVNGAEGNRLLFHEEVQLQPGWPLYRNYNHVFTEILKNSRTTRKIPLKIKLSVTPKGILLYGKDEDGIELQKLFPEEINISQQPEKSAASFREQLSKSGDTPFEILEIEIIWEQPIFLPVSRINAIRRQFLDDFTEWRIRQHPRPVPPKRDLTVSWPEDEITYLGNISNHLAEAFYHMHGVNKIEPALEASHDYRGKRLMTMKHCLKYSLGYCPREKTGKIFPWKEPLYLSDGKKKFRLEFDCASCRMNLYC